MESDAAFYEECGGWFTPTRHTEGPWSSQHQHGGPPAALLARAVERGIEGEDLLVARLSFDILRAVAIAPVQVRVRVLRPGRRVRLLEATLVQGDQPLARVTAWALRAVPEGVPASGGIGPPPLPPGDPERSSELAPAWRCGFLDAMEWRWVRGGYTTSGPATVWIRPRLALLRGEPMSPLQRVVLTADSANGVSGVLDIGSWSFIPPELTIHCLRPPRGEWLCLDAVTTLFSGAGGLATSRLHDREGVVATSAQSLLVAARPVPGGAAGS